MIKTLSAKVWSVAVTPLFSVEYGTIDEFVYKKDVDGNYKKISELDWDIKPALYFGGAVGVLWKALSIQGFARGAVPMRSGNMEDSDWKTLTDLKTTYSIHKNMLASSYAFGGQISYAFQIADTFAIRPFCGVDYSRIAFKARNGRAWEGYDILTHTGVAWNDPTAKPYVPLGIDYTREEVHTWFGVSFDTFFNNKFTLALSFAFAPYTYIQALDHHYGGSGTSSDRYFADILHGWFSSYRFGAEAVYAFNKNISLSLAFSWMLTRRIRGATYEATRPTGSWHGTDDAEGGASRSTGEISLGCTYRLNF
ncbi:omptin family outer membrane protease [Treponema sp. Marseille-Q4130]|uniref:omptin family outer membrane protease n=1 Tax=Treponema sp. Marseille-Q4130 TaxID=2766702 RepID=UPI001651C7CF|nr:omptin family outer membrane protease [Treponema sp. Marseille-Q4130]MBC6720628.1 omptin family outer membrane protease [Treponema sp. Marseille-Q4130]